MILAVAFAGVAYLPTKGLASLIMTSYASLPDARVSVGTLQTRSTEKAAQKRTLLEEIRNANANWLLRWERALNYSVSYHYERIHIDGDGEEEAVFSVPLKGLYDRGIDFLPEGRPAARRRSFPSPIGQLRERMVTKIHLQTLSLLATDVLVDGPSLRVLGEDMWMRETFLDGPKAVRVLEFSDYNGDFHARMFSQVDHKEEWYDPDDPAVWWYTRGPGSPDTYLDSRRTWNGRFIQGLLFVTETYDWRGEWVSRIRDVKVERLPYLDSEYATRISVLYGVPWAF
ncbi:MAG: hypothetical protein B1H03_00150 [Planctomycetales bacterium 4484_113]|nr:MAG: hypothetical protein B1H03_00150 [Planctomycetales bacterium 4484_113]